MSSFTVFWIFVAVGMASDRVNGDTQCTNQGGTCQYTSVSCEGTYQSGLCSGPADRKCCIPYDDSACTAVNGVCQDDNNPCQGGSYQSGLCGGPTGRRCCVPTSASTEVGICAQVTRILRAEWSARNPSTTLAVLPSTPVDNVFIHHTAGAPCYTKDECEQRMREIQDFHMDDRAFSDIGYNWLIGGDNRAYEGRGWGYVGAHTYGCNSNAVAISLMGNYDTATPTTDMMKATRDIIDCGIQQGYIAPWATVRMFGHRDSPCSSTACPGQNVYNIITGWPWYSNTTPPCQC